MSGASWYWPFDWPSRAEDSAADAPRLSELLEPASELIDEASDLAAEGKTQEAIEKYRKSLEELNRIEMENPERVKTQEMATLKNKRAYVNAAIDSLLLDQVRSNARAVAVSDTTELEKKLAEEKAAKRKGEKREKAEETLPAPETGAATVAEPVAKPIAKPVVSETRPADGKDRVSYDIAHGDYDDALATVEAMLKATPNDPMSLNLKAAIFMSQGKTKEAEETLDQAIMSNPRDHYAYYNMALLVLGEDPPRLQVAKRYYETGRAVGGPEDKELEAMLK